MTFPTQESTVGAVSNALSGFGGFLRCRSCERREGVGSTRLHIAHGWPKCCGYTMEWITQRQIDEGYLDDPDAWLAKEHAR